VDCISNYLNINQCQLTLVGSSIDVNDKITIYLDLNDGFVNLLIVIAVYETHIIEEPFNIFDTINKRNIFTLFAYVFWYDKYYTHTMSCLLQKKKNFLPNNTKKQQIVE